MTVELHSFKGLGGKKEGVLLSDQNYQKCSIKKDNSLEKAVGFVGAMIISELHFIPQNLYGSLETALPITLY